MMTMEHKKHVAHVRRFMDVHSGILINFYSASFRNSCKRRRGQPIYHLFPCLCPLSGGFATKNHSNNSHNSTWERCAGKVLISGSIWSQTTCDAAQWVSDYFREISCTLKSKQELQQRQNKRKWKPIQHTGATRITTNLPKKSQFSGTETSTVSENEGFGPRKQRGRQDKWRKAHSSPLIHYAKVSTCLVSRSILWPCTSSWFCSTRGWRVINIIMKYKKDDGDRHNVAIDGLVEHNS